MSEKAAFDPAQHLSKVKGQDYLEVRWRIAWFRSRFPAGRIDTDVHLINDTVAIIRASVTAIDDGGEIRGSATGIGTCTAESFGDYIEKAETKAIGRALAGLGFGTQFADDFDDGDAVTDRAVSRTSYASRPQPSRPAVTSSSSEPPTDAQRSLMTRLGKDAGVSPEEMEDLCIQHGGGGWHELTKTGASRVIDALRALPKAATR